MRQRQIADEGLARLRVATTALDVEIKFLRFLLRLKAGFRPDQARVPAGNPEGGQWTDEGGSARFTLVSRRPRSAPSTVRINGQLLPLTPAQQIRLDQSLVAMRQALRELRRVEPRWKPPAQAYETVEGLIGANRAVEAAARFRLFDLRGTPVGPGPNATGWITAPPTNRRLNPGEQAAINDIGRRNGCHRCGRREPGTPSGNFVGDHQMPKSMGTPTRIYPHCLGCSMSQGGLVRGRRY